MIDISRHLATVRLERGLSQAELAERCRLKRQQVTFFEAGARVPSLAHLLRIARALDVSLERLLYGSDRPGTTSQDIASELRGLGLIDLWVEEPVVRGAFRRTEEIVALAICESQPVPRIVEALPAVLAWNRWNDVLLWAFARGAGRAILYRVAWLADIALAIDRAGGFPGGCLGKNDLVMFLKRVKSPRRERWDSLGSPASEIPNSPIWKRWRINYAADLSTFRHRAESLLALGKAEGRTESAFNR